MGSFCLSITRMTTPERSEDTNVKGSAWSITINNPTPSDHEAIELLKTMKWFRKWEGQIEQGENGTPHIQAALHTEYIRFAAVKKVLRRAHIERARRTEDLVAYVHKPGSRVAELPTVTRTSPADVEKRCYQAVITHLQNESKGSSAYDEEYLRNVLIGSEENVSLLEAFRRIDAMTLFDGEVSKLIAEGGQLEMWASNPLVRSAFKKYFQAIIIRNARSYSQGEDGICAAGSSAAENPQQDESTEEGHDE